MSKSVIVVTGCDAKFYPFMEQALESLIALNIDRKAHIGILDLGLSPQQVDALKAKGYEVKLPTWTLSVPEDKRIQHQLGLVARTALREYFPGYKVYLWFDADAWAQTPEFFELMTAGAMAKGAAIVREDGAGYKRDLVYARWWFGNMVASYGIVKGLSVALKPVINIGILALSDTAPHWEAWIRYYQAFIEKRGRVNNQHSFNAALALDHLPYAHMPARCNWICTLGTPEWDPQKKLLVEPGGLPLSVVHMAGPDKEKIYHLKHTKGGGATDTALTYPVIRAL